MSHSSLHKAAIILKSLPKVQAAKILARLDLGDLKTIFDALDKVDRVSSTQICDAMMDLESLIGDRSEIAKSDPTSGHGQSLQDRVGDSQLEPGADYQPFDFIKDIEPDLRTKLLENEHPRYIAEVVAQLDPKVASEIVGGLEPALRVSVLRRVCSTDVPAAEDVAQLSYALKLRLKKLLNERKQGPSRVGFAAELLSASDDQTRQDIITHVEQQDPELAQELQRSLLHFSDIAKASDEEVRRLLKVTDTTLWAPALKNASLETRRKILDNMAERVAALLSQEISNIGPIDQQVADRAQQMVIQQFLTVRKSSEKNSESPQPIFPSVIAQPNVTDPIFIKTR